MESVSIWMSLTFGIGRPNMSKRPRPNINKFLSLYKIIRSDWPFAEKSSNAGHMKSLKRRYRFKFISKFLHGSHFGAACTVTHNSGRHEPSHKYLLPLLRRTSCFLSWTERIKADKSAPRPTLAKLHRTCAMLQWRSSTTLLECPQPDKISLVGWEGNIEMDAGKTQRESGSVSWPVRLSSLSEELVSTGKYRESTRKQDSLLLTNKLHTHYPHRILEPLHLAF